MSMKSFVDQNPRFEDGSLTPRAYLEDCLEVIDQRESVVQAFEYLNIEAARRAADEATERYRSKRTRSVLDGCPIGVKDIIETRDMPTCFGSPAFKNNHTNRDAACVQALRQAGAIMLGKTVTTEFAIGFSGKTTNPHDAERTPGGSSSGSAAAVGAGMLPLALGTQTNGSILRPASYTGSIGYKGTFGTLPVGGIHPVALSHDHLGLFGTTVQDIWAGVTQIIAFAGAPAFEQLKGLDRAIEPRMPKRLVRLHLNAWEEVEEAERVVFDQFVAELADKGIEIIDRTSDRRVASFETALDQHSAGSSKMLAHDIRWPFAGYIEQYGRQIGDRLHGLVKESSQITPGIYQDLLSSRREMRQATAELIRDTGSDAYILPAASGPAPKGFEFTGSRAYLVYWSWLGFPAFSLPLLHAQGLPWGVQLAGIAQEDKALADLAAWLIR
jgi:Asp-tRNA(Asn)/Glu-tRNA(Gln) amidotransferase A subunit family amidase